MRKPAKVPQQQQVIRDADVLVADPKGLRDSCLRAIKKVLGDQYLKFEMIASDPAHEVWCVGGQAATLAYTKYAYTVLPLRVSGSILYWVGVSLDFHRDSTRRGAVYLKGIGILFVAGDALDPQKRQLLRIEWDCRHGYTEEDHAQPHWHVHPHWPMVMVDVGQVGFLEEGASAEFVPPADDVQAGNPSPDMALEFVPPATAVLEFGEPGRVGLDVARFHFALAAQWHNGNLHNPALTEDQVPVWIERCIGYTQQQLTYLHRKAGDRTG